MDHMANKLTFIVILHRGLCVQTIRSRDLHYTQVPCQILSVGTLQRKTLDTRSLFHEKFRRGRHRQSQIGGVLTFFPAPCRRGNHRRGLLHHHACLRSDAWVVHLGTTGRLSLYLVLSCIDLVSCLTWSRSSYCNATCCVCWDSMNVDTMSSQSIELSCLCCLWSCMLSVVSRCFGQVDASDSKRGYLC